MPKWSNASLLSREGLPCVAIQFCLAALVLAAAFAADSVRPKGAGAAAKPAVVRRAAALVKRGGGFGQTGGGFGTTGGGSGFGATTNGNTGFGGGPALGTTVQAVCLAIARWAAASPGDRVTLWARPVVRGALPGWGLPTPRRAFSRATGRETLSAAEPVTCRTSSAVWPWRVAWPRKVCKVVAEASSRARGATTAAISSSRTAGDATAARRMRQVRTVLSVGFDLPPRDQSALASTVAQRLVRSRGVEAMSPVTVTMQGRTAVLLGVVPTEHAKSVAEQLALLEPGVSQVQNDLTVSEVPAGPATEASATATPPARPAATPRGAACGGDAARGRG